MEAVVPIENERKLILRVDDPVLLLTTLKLQPDVQVFDITQGYINGSARIRHVVPHAPGDEKFIFTHKSKVLGSTVEIECDVSIHDFQKLFLIAKPVLHKTRAKWKDGLHTWDVDFFRVPKSGSTYLCMAEVEMPEFETQTPEPHSLLKPYAFKWIDAGDKRFNNKNLSNTTKVLKLLKGLGL
jgi:CYTH domain-containing protein